MLSCKICEIFKNTFLYRKAPVAASIYFAFHKRFFFYFSPCALPLIPCSAVTFFVWRNTFVFTSQLLHHYYHNSRTIHQDCSNLYDLLHCHLISMIVIRISALIEFMVKRKKQHMNKVKLKNILSFRHVISLICQEVWFL